MESQFQPPKIDLERTAESIIAISWFTVLLRIWTRGKIVKLLGWDDLSMVFAAMCYTVYCVSLIILSKNLKSEAFAHLQRDILLSTFGIALVIECFYVLTMVVFKISLALFFLRVMIMPWQRRIAYATMAISIVYGLAYCLFLIFQCGYVDGSFELLLRNVSGQCVSHTTYLTLSYINATINSLGDVIFVTLPLLLLRESRMRSRDKVTVIFVLILGAGGVICSVPRFYYLPRLLEPNLNQFIHSNFSLGQWSLLEPGMGIVANNLGTLRPLLRIITKRTGSSSAMYSTDRSKTVHLDVEMLTGSATRLSREDAQIQLGQRKEPTLNTHGLDQ